VELFRQLQKCARCLSIDGRDNSRYIPVASITMQPGHIRHAMMMALALGLVACSPEARSGRGWGGSGGSDTPTGGGSTGKKGGSGGSGKGGSGGSKAGGATGGNAAGGNAGGATGGNATGGATGGDAAGGAPVDVPPVGRTGYFFEEGTDTWEGSATSRNQAAVAVALSDTPVLEGKKALAVTVDVDAFKNAGIGQCTWPLCGQYVGVMMPADTSLASGKTITFSVFVPSGVPLFSIQPFIMTNDTQMQKWNWFGSWTGAETVQRDAWTEIKLAYPNNTEDFWEIGIEFLFSAGGKHTVYVDNVHW